jgi:LuxR family maltose regulon positive regulatory protein
VSTLAQALALAAPGGYVRTFVDEGSQISALLSEVLDARQKGRSKLPGRFPEHYPRTLLAALERDASRAASADGRIAEPLSVGTVKTHARNIYRKLDSHSRTQALARARELL